MRFTLSPLFVQQNFPGLAGVSHPPDELYVEAKSESALALLEKLPSHGFAIVGSRCCQPRSARLVHSIVQELSGSELVILSGLARGIDAEAHHAALEAGLPTIAVLGCGLDLQYPRENQTLRERIVESGGLVISELPAAHEPMPWSFLRRNRLIAGWSRATWVVEAGFRSGALNTAKWARDQGRTCFTTPCFPGDPSLAGNQRLLMTGTDAALPLWNILSLAEVWLDLESFAALKAHCERDDSKALLAEIRLRTAQNGGVGIAELIQWAMLRKMPAEKLLRLLGHVEEKGYFSRKNGTLTAT